jgi:hypothetical protein
VLIGKLAHPPKPQPGKRGPRKATYGTDVVTPLVKLWKIFDYPCGQRLAPAIEQEVENLRKANEIKCSNEVAAKLMLISPRTIDRLLAREKQVLGLRQNRNPSSHPLLYQKILMKVASEWDTEQIGNLQVDYVLHSGRSVRGEFLHTISAVDIATGWWEAEAILRRTQENTCNGLDSIRKRLPFRVLEIHPDNDTGMINDLVWRYCKNARIKMSRSRPYKKNDNCWVEQKNWTHVRKVVGYRRMDSTEELEIVRECYAKVCLYKNYFQPTMKLVEKIREGGKIRRKYDEPRTPYQRMMESDQIAASSKKKLKQQYESMNAAELRRQVEESRNRLFDAIEGKPEQDLRAKGRGRSITVHGQAHGIWMEQMLGKKK